MPSPRHGLILFALASAACHRPEPPAPRHVLLVVIDTQRADHLSCYGYARPTSPTIDALAKEGVLFEHCVSQASWTLPSMVSMMTSSYVAEEALRIPDAKTTLAEAFHEHGYATGAFICNDLLSPDNRFERGFDAFEWKLVPYGSNQPILDWIRAHKDGPTFTYVHLNEVHDDVHRPDGSNYGPDPVAQKGRFRKQKGALTAERLEYYTGVSEKLHLVQKDASLAKIEAEIGGYDDDVEYSDHRIGEILEEYKKLGLWDSTAVAIAADHGEGLWTREQFPEGTRWSATVRGEPATLVNMLQMTHGSQAAIELVHVPFVLKAPGYVAARVGTWVENVDIGPTLLGLCRIEPPKTAQGKNLLGAAAAKRVDEAVFSYTRYQWSAISQEGMQLLFPTSRGECEFALAEELYDLPRDPESRRNLLARDRPLALEKLGTERVKNGIRGGSGTISPQLLKSLAGLGYLDTGTVDVVNAQLADTSTEDLIQGIQDSHDCLFRLQMLHALKGRRLAADHKAALRRIFSKESSLAIREDIEQILLH
jgi:arylsulfatase A-like enzyme